MLNRKVSYKIYLVTVESLLIKINEIFMRISLNQKPDAILTNSIEIRVINDNLILSLYDLNDYKLLNNMHNKFPSLISFKDQITKLNPSLKIVYDFDTTSKKLYLILNFQNFYLKENALNNAIMNFKSLREIEVNDSQGADEDFIKSLKNNTSIKKVIFKQIKLFDEIRIKNVLAGLNNSVEKLCMKDLHITGEVITDIFGPFFNSNSNLVSLNLTKNKIDLNSNGIEALKDLLVRSKVPLKKLNLSNNIIKSENFSNNLGEIIKVKHLTKLKLGRCQLNKLEIFTNLYNYVKPLNLQVLDLSFNYIELDLISDFIGNNPNITKLILQKIRIPKTSDLRRFGNVFISSQSLKTLGFYYDIIDENNKTTADPSRLIEFYSGFTAQPGCEKSYKSYRMELTAEIMTHFASILIANDCLTEVNFSLCNFKEKCFEIFLSSFNNSVKLKTLILDSIEVESEDIKALAQIVKSAKSLNKLDISNTKISTEDLNLIGDAIASNPEIKTIYLSNCLAEDTKANEFFKKLSNSSLQEIDFSFNSGKENYSEAFGNFLNSCISLKTVKIGTKQEDFLIKLNNKLFNITNKLNIENLTVTNIKFDGNSMKEIILNCDKLKTITLNNAVKNSNFIKYLVQKNQALDHLEFSVTDIDNEDVPYFTQFLYSVKKFIFRTTHLRNDQAESIFEGLNSNKKIEHFEILFEKFNDKEYVNSLKKYYSNIQKCDLLTNLMIFKIDEENEENLKKELKENSKNMFLELSKSFFI